MKNAAGVDELMSIIVDFSAMICRRSYRAALQTVFDSRVNIIKEVTELEVSERILALKIHKKELTLSRLSQLVDESDHCRVNTAMS